MTRWRSRSRPRSEQFEHRPHAWLLDGIRAAAFRLAPYAYNRPKAAIRFRIAHHRAWRKVSPQPHQDEDAIAAYRTLVIERAIVKRLLGKNQKKEDGHGDYERDGTFEPLARQQCA